MTTIAQLGFAIDSSPAATASDNLDKLAESGARAEQTIADVGTASKEASAALSDVTSATQTAMSAQDRAGQVVQAASISTKQYAQALRLLPVQIHQAFDQLLYGTNPLVVLSTQVPQITESFGGFGGALRALAGFITPASVGLTALAAAVGTVGYAWYEAEAEQDGFRKKLITTGDSVGLTVSQLETLRRKIEDVGGVSRGNASAALTDTISAGITNNVEQVAKLAAQMQQLGGIPIDQTVKEFAALGQDPVRAAESLQRSLAFLTPQVYDEIVALEKQGKTAQAAAVAQSQLASALGDFSSQLKETQGDWDRFKTSLSTGTSHLMDWLAGTIDPSLPERIATLATRIQTLKANAATDPYAKGEIATLQKELDSLTTQESALDAKAKSAQENAAKTAADIQQKQEKLADQAAQITAKAVYGGISDAAQGGAIQRALQLNLDTYQRYGALLDADHSAHLISDEAYYGAKRKLIDDDTKATVNSLEQQNALLERQIARLNQASAAFDAANHTPAEITKNDADTAQKVAGLQQTILNNQLKINLAEVDGANKAALLGKAQVAASTAAAQVLANLRASQEQYLQTLQRSHDLQLQSLTEGPTGRQRLSDISQIDQQYLQQRQQLDQAKRINPELPNYDAQLRVIEDTHQKALADTDAYYKALDKAQSDWLTGAKGAYATYEESALNVASLTQNAFTDALNGIEDAFTTFATTGKLSFRSLADSIIADIGRIVAKEATAGLASLAGGIFGASDFGAAGFGSAADSLISGGFSLASIGAAAGGGPISGPTIVGERGPELFVPNTSGFVVPNDKLASMSAGPVINFRPIYQIGSGVDRAQVIAAMAQTQKSTIAQVSNLIKGGAFSG